MKISCFCNTNRRVWFVFVKRLYEKLLCNQNSHLSDASNLSPILLTWLEDVASKVRKMVSSTPKSGHKTTLPCNKPYKIVITYCYLYAYFSFWCIVYLGFSVCYGPTLYRLFLYCSVPVTASCTSLYFCYLFLAFSKVVICPLTFPQHWWVCCWTRC